MRPVLVNILGLELHPYPVMLALAFISCTLLACRKSWVRGEGFVLTPHAGLWAYLGALIGAKTFWILQYSEARYLWRIVFIWEGGLVYYGGLIGGLLALTIHLLLRRIPLIKAGDIAAPYLALGQAITRIGCFLNGCCYGTPTDVPWAVRFPPGAWVYRAQLREGLIEPSTATTLPVHPTQLYMHLGLLGIFLLLKRCLDRKPFDGAVVLLYMFAYGVLRFVAEFFRGDSARSILGMTVSQAISLALVVLALVGFATVARRGTCLVRDGKGGNDLRDKPGMPNERR